MAVCRDCFETLVFVLIGLSLRGVLDRLGGTAVAIQQAAPMAMAVVCAVLLSRLVWVVPGSYLSRVISPSLRRTDPVKLSVGGGHRVGRDARGL